MRGCTRRASLPRSTRQGCSQRFGRQNVPELSFDSIFKIQASSFDRLINLSRTGGVSQTRRRDLGRGQDYA